MKFKFKQIGEYVSDIYGPFRGMKDIGNVLTGGFYDYFDAGLTVLGVGLLFNDQTWGSDLYGILFAGTGLLLPAMLNHGLNNDSKNIEINDERTHRNGCLALATAIPFLVGGENIGYIGTTLKNLGALTFGGLALSYDISYKNLRRQIRENKNSDQKKQNGPLEDLVQ